MITDARREPIPTHDDASIDAAQAEADRASARAEQARLRAAELRRRAAAVHGASQSAPKSEPIANDSTDCGFGDDAGLEAQRASARAEQARLRATELRRRADAMAQVGLDPAQESERAAPSISALRRWRPRRPSPRSLAVALAVLLVCASAGACGSMWWRHRTLLEERQRTAEFTSAARTELTDLMSIDYTKARDGVQRVIDDSTGQFKDQFQASADDLVAGLEQSKVLTSVTIKAVAIKAMTKDSAVVLVAATSQASSLQGARRDPRDFRVELTLLRDDGQLKLSRVEFVK
jgi:Mce-associated membrane protein